MRKVVGGRFQSQVTATPLLASRAPGARTTTCRGAGPRTGTHATTSARRRRSSSRRCFPTPSTRSMPHLQAQCGAQRVAKGVLSAAVVSLTGSAMCRYVRSARAGRRRTRTTGTSSGQTRTGSACTLTSAAITSPPLYPASSRSSAWPAFFAKCLAGMPAELAPRRRRKSTTSATTTS